MATLEFNIKTNNSVYDFYRNGRSFMEAAWRCYGKEKDGQYLIIGNGELCQLTAPTIVNAAFACEMFLKCLLLHYKISYKKEHSLIKLYNILPDNAKNIINKFCGDIKDETVFIDKLSHHANDFIDVRYFIENEGWKGMSPTYMLSLATNLSTITKYILDNPV